MKKLVGALVLGQGSDTNQKRRRQVNEPVSALTVLVYLSMAQQKLTDRGLQAKTNSQC